MTAEALLKIVRHGDIFTGDPSVAKKEFHELARKWHPDVNKDKKATDVFQHIKQLYERACQDFEKGMWESVETLYFTTKREGEQHLEYQTKREFELGTYYIGRSHLTYFIRPEFKELYDNAFVATNRHEYKSDRIKKEISRCLADNPWAFETKDGMLGLAFAKKPKFLSLRDVVNHYGKMDPKHTAWIISTMYNLCCFFQTCHVTHNNISLDTYFISPEDHVGLLLGGWWYAKTRGHKLEKIPKRTFAVLPWEVKNKKKALSVTDLELVRLVGREMSDTMSLPGPMESWFKNVAGGDAIEEYSRWGEVLEESFGARKFTKMELDETKLYKRS